jgi:hypothetical protein
MVACASRSILKVDKFNFFLNKNTKYAEEEKNLE